MLGVLANRILSTETCRSFYPLPFYFTHKLPLKDFTFWKQYGQKKVHFTNSFIFLLNFMLSYSLIWKVKCYMKYTEFVLFWLFISTNMTTVSLQLHHILNFLELESLYNLFCCFFLKLNVLCKECFGVFSCRRKMNTLMWWNIGFLNLGFSFLPVKLF